ncbi:MAG: MarR family transcriptional regulator [Dehalococcoidia bacterium]|jgi:DNA-binding MarR family transcriptional regulator
MEALVTEEHEIAVLIRRIDLLLSKTRRNELEHLGITPAQAGVLHFIQMFEKPCTIIQLRKSMGRSNSSMVGIINRMERGGLIKRQVDSQSKKYTRVLLTEKGKALYEEAVSLNGFITVVSSLPKEDRQRLKLYLSALTETARKVLEEQQNSRKKTHKRELSVSSKVAPR